MEESRGKPKKNVIRALVNYQSESVVTSVHVHERLFEIESVPNSLFKAKINKLHNIGFVLDKKPVRNSNMLMLSGVN